MNSWWDCAMLVPPYNFFTMIFRKLILSLALFGWLGVSSQGADVFDMGGVRDTSTGTWTGLASVEFVPVGDAGNAADPDTGYGRVDYAFNMGKYDVTAGQYCAFLNAVAKNADPYGLYNTNMNIANYSTGCNIVRSVSAGKYSYTVAADWANRPVNFVSWGDAVRFCNWLQNGQKTGNEDNSTTETGAYTLSGANTDPALMAVNRNPNATYFIPSLNEWYKAAYYDPNKNGPGQPGYWKYPTKSDSQPINILDPAATNNANFLDLRGTGNHTYTIGDPYWRTEVGAFASSPSPYGTFDQGGNIVQWNETAVTAASRGTFGGAFGGGYSHLSKMAGSDSYPTQDGSDGGFRVAHSSVPEPTVILMLLICSPAVFFIGVSKNILP